MRRKILLVLGLAFLLVVVYTYIPLFPSAAQPANQVESPAGEAPEELEAERPLVVPTLAIKESAFNEKQLDTFDWSKVEGSTLSDLSYG